jgi:nitronate monooxygenase
MGADMACLGTRFIATREAGVPDAYRQMIVDSDADEVVYTDAVVGIPANFMRRSLLENGLDPATLAAPPQGGRPSLPDGVRPWRTLWSAGHSVGLIEDTPSVEVVVDRLVQDFATHAPATAWRERLDASLAQPRAARQTPPAFVSPS